MSRRLVIVEHPFSADSEKFTTYLKECLQDTLRRDESAMASVAIYVLTGALNDLNAVERAAGIAAGLEWYRVAERCAVYRDWGISTGMIEGIAHAQQLRLPIEYRTILEKP